jgi:hypothetical protein
MKRPGRNAAAVRRSTVKGSFSGATMDHYLFCVTETPPPAEAASPETEEDRRQHEAARLDVAPARPGDDPPTYGDEGGGSLYPEQSLEEVPSLLRRLGLHAARLRRRLFSR